jgi:hypothetical protein
MKNLFSLKNILIIALAIFVILEILNPFGIMPGKTVLVNGKPYEVIKHEIDTVDIIKTKVVTKKGEDIFHETILHDTTVKLMNVDSAAILKNFYAKNIYKDKLVLDDGLGTIMITDTITENKILGRKWNADVKQRTIKETTIVKELPKTQVFYGVESGFNQKDVVSHVGAGLIVKTKKDKLLHLGLGVANRTVDGVNGGFTPYVSGGVYWKISLRK